MGNNLPTVVTLTHGGEAAIRSAADFIGELAGDRPVVLMHSPDGRSRHSAAVLGEVLGVFLIEKEWLHYAHGEAYVSRSFKLDVASLSPDHVVVLVTHFEIIRFIAQIQGNEFPEHVLARLAEVFVDGGSRFRP